MARLLGVLFTIVALSLTLASAEGQETKKGKLDVDAVFKKLDVNGDGKLSRDEFLKLADRYKNKEKAREKLTMAYDKIDPNHVGLSRGQFRSYLESALKKRDEKK